MNLSIQSFNIPPPQSNPQAFAHCPCPGGGEVEPCWGGAFELEISSLSSETEVFYLYQLLILPSKRNDHQILHLGGAF